MMKNNNRKNNPKKIVALLMAALLLLTLSACSGKKYTEEDAKDILSNFGKLAEIPRQSGSCSAVSDYLFSWAENLGLNTDLVLKPVQDEAGNVIIDVPARGRNMDNKPLTILQAHMDMVCMPQPDDSDKSEEGYNPLTDEILPVYSDGKLYAAETSVGADNGIGIALIQDYILSDSPHGPLRVIFTADEETDMAGAKALSSEYTEDAVYMINFDGKVSSQIITSAFAEKIYTVLLQDTKHEEVSHDSTIAIRINGVKGGSSGQTALRINANEAIVNGLYRAKEAGVDFRLSYIYGGYTDTDYSRDTTAILTINDADVKDFWDAFKQVCDEYTAEYISDDSNFSCGITASVTPETVYSAAETERIIDCLYRICAQGKTSDTAVSIGRLRIGSGGIGFTINLRSRTDALMNTLTQENETILGEYSFIPELNMEVPAWTASESSFAELAASRYRKLTGEKAALKDVRDGLECGYFAAKNPALSIISLGPDIFDEHTVEEFCNVESACLVEDWLAEILKSIK